MTQLGPVRIHLVDVEQIIDLRWRILRAGLPRETAYFEGDDEPTTRHLAAIRADAVIGCATILRRPWQGKPAWQLRGMAVEPAFQSGGVGRMLVNEIERIVRSEPHSLQLWCNARTPATPFYRRLGWTTEGQEFEIPSAGPHFKMHKFLI
jgi:GNAT superfamily N-acetyltransferase